ncbi:MAG: hypothetical protein ACXVDK_17540, partial [Bacteroidia bacterium]
MEEFEQPQEPRRSNPFLPLYFSIVLVLGILGGYFFSFHNTLTQLPDTAGFHKSQFSKINNLLEYIEMQYVDTINEHQLVEKTVTSMLHSLDPHSDYIPAEQFKQVNEPLQGTFDGIGVEFNIIGDT